ncbi:hypothetical protein LAZ67_12000594 [Cordylochernes scorpioides]|uniref:Peptidase aspartic putative domain-containing protein n=1 Tax=Cordylochernes scorpioides TaxID=51811 RepID=A0ABY6L0M0_9ARAC|nr:hypothetical protein LAZ67_12000594 [Cordylochernes scorpioides]
MGIDSVPFTGQLPCPLYVQGSLVDMASARTGHDNHENPRTTLLELEQDTGISETTIGRIVTEDLKLKKTPAKFIPRFLTNEQKLCRLATCEDMMEITRTDPEWKDKIITGDETWVYGYDPETKPQSAEWRVVVSNEEPQIFYELLSPVLRLLSFTVLQLPGREEKAVPIFGTLLDQKMEREEALERLKKKRTILRTSLSKYGKRIEEYDVHKECDHEELLGQLSDVYEELRRVDEEIGKLIDIKDLEKDLKMVEEYREKAVAWKYLLKKRSLVVAEGMQRETATATKKEYPGEIGRPTLTGMVKLPKLTMERFYGEISQWLNFWNAFDSSINRNEHLTKIDKFNYLKAYLGGTAAQTVEGFCLSEENYDKAVELLKKRFGKGERKNQNATPARGIMRDETLTNLTTPVVLLPTLRVTIRGKCKERMGRILIDTGSQRSYVLQDTAEEMGYECSKKESLRHSLFGGSNTELYEHGVYDIRLSNLDGSYGCNFEALSQDVICDSVPRVHQGKWMHDLSAHDIELTDLHRGPLEILIGADIAGKLLTGEHRRLPSGLVAVQTRLGWTLMGKIPATEEETSSEIGVSSDIEKAFLQIGIREEDRDYLRFLWYDKEGNVMVLRHARVVFGITTSPYLLLATLFHHLNKAPEHWQETAELLRESLYIDNCVASFSKVTDMEKFVDEAQRLASYATCIFLRIESEQEVTCQLVQARSRVAPLKGTTIPRLELLACLVGARLVNNVVRDLKFEDMERFYWTDSMNALHWIKGKDNWATFVMNRVMEIRSLSETED